VFDSLVSICTGASESLYREVYLLLFLVLAAVDRASNYKVCCCNSYKIMQVYSARMKTFNRCLQLLATVFNNHADIQHSDRRHHD
jgi:hypothetical protein